jgi:16S rRNA A1518/A1519 N6-dimethyltransferase RsmA/KsgA/DIM1 with predicted DNA glycosylase/AP lyase activity
MGEGAAEALSAVGIDPRARAESVSPERWLALARVWSGPQKPGGAP